MVNRCDSRHRIYTELCNRSSTSSLGLSHVGSLTRPNCDLHEDYWEDASVSLRSCHSWEASTSPWLGGPVSPAHENTDTENGSKIFSGFDSGQIRRHSCSFDANVYVAALKSGRHSFPPPLALCPTLSIKGGGRFVLKEMDADRPQGFFRAQRGNGRLRLELILPDEVDDEEDSHEETPSPAEDMVECGAYGHEEHGAHDEEAILSSPEDCPTADENGTDVEYAEFNESAAAQDISLGSSEIDGGTKSPSIGVISDDTNWNDSTCVKQVGFSECDSYVTDNFREFANVELNQFLATSSNSHVEQEPLWNVDARHQALASLSPWSANQLCAHESIACLRPALGLAMS